MKRLILTFLCCFSLSATVTEAIDPFIQSALEAYTVPGAAVVIVHDGKILLEKGYGVKEIGKEGKVDADTLFQLASVSKTFTAAGLGVQVSRKGLSWDQPIADHLPEFVFSVPYIRSFASARDLLAHRTSLPAFQGDLLGDLGYSRKEILNRVQFIQPTGSFREKALYSNVGFFIAGELLSALSGERFEASLQKTLLNPLGMSRTGFSDRLNDPNAAKNHAVIEGKLQVIPYSDSSVFTAAGGVVSSAPDLGTWMNLWLSGDDTILSREVISEILAPSMVGEVGFTELFPITSESSFAYGLGWNNYQYKGAYIVEKGGALGGIRTIVTLIPEKKMGIAILANKNVTVLPEVIRAKWLQLILDPNATFSEKPFQEAAKSLDKLFDPEAPPQTVIPFSRDLALCSGTYHSDLYGDVTISVKGKELALKAGPSRYQGTLKHLSNDSFNLSWPQINQGNQVVTFTFGKEGAALEFTTETLGRFTRISKDN
jgi:CubicO group peptidase (beta-lactamase class C family)